jgi:hypothetical protein
MKSSRIRNTGLQLTSGSRWGWWRLLHGRWISIPPASGSPLLILLPIVGVEVVAVLLVPDLLDVVRALVVLAAAAATVVQSTVAMMARGQWVMVIKTGTLVRTRAPTTFHHTVKIGIKYQKISNIFTVLKLIPVPVPLRKDTQHRCHEQKHTRTVGFTPSGE